MDLSSVVRQLVGRPANWCRSQAGGRGNGVASQGIRVCILCRGVTRRRAAQHCSARRHGINLAIHILVQRCTDTCVRRKGDGDGHRCRHVRGKIVFFPTPSAPYRAVCPHVCPPICPPTRPRKPPPAPCLHAVPTSREPPPNPPCPRTRTHSRARPARPALPLQPRFHARFPAAAAPPCRSAAISHPSWPYSSPSTSPVCDTLAPRLVAASMSFGPPTHLPLPARARRMCLGPAPIPSVSLPR